MSKVVLTLLLALTITNTRAQDYRQAEHRPERYGQRRPLRHDMVTPLFLGTSTGFNNPSGFLGLDIDILAARDFSLDFGVGTSTWGTKVCAEGKFYFRTSRKRVALGVGFSHSSGLSTETLSLATVNYGTQPVSLSLHQESNFFLLAYRFFRIGHRANRFYIDAGYSFRLSEVQYDVNNGYILTDNSQAAVKILAPGGIIIGCGFQFGFYRAY